MRAVAIEGFGGREKLRVVDIPKPEAGPGEVLVRIRAAGVGPWDAKAREGFFGERSFPYVLGFEAAGVVEGVGSGVGGETFRQSFGVLRDGGRVVTIVAFGEEVDPGRGITYRAFSAPPDHRKLEAVSKMIDAGKVRVEVEDVLSLEDAAKAHERIEEGHTRGKIVLKVA